MSSHMRDLPALKSLAVSLAAEAGASPSTVSVSDDMAGALPPPHPRERWRAPWVSLLPRSLWGAAPSGVPCRNTQDKVSLCAAN